MKLSGPTYFSEIIAAAANHAKESSLTKEQQYSILLILTDGEIMDMEKTVDAIVKASLTSPLSIIIVGVGNANFRNMGVLDGDDKKLRNSRGEEIKRDLVQFVAYRTSNDARSTIPGTELTSRVLSEIPDQVVGYFHKQGIAPKRPIEVAEEEIVVMPDLVVEDEIVFFPEM